MRTKINLPDPIGQGRPQGHRIASKSLADAKHLVLERDFAVLLDLSHDVPRAIFDRGQQLWKRASADLIATGRHLHPQGLVGALVIIDGTPSIKAGLNLGVTPVTASLQQLDL